MHWKFLLSDPTHWYFILIRLYIIPNYPWKFKNHVRFMQIVTLYHHHLNPNFSLVLCYQLMLFFVPVLIISVCSPSLNLTWHVARRRFFFFITSFFQKKVLSYISLYIYIYTTYEIKFKISVTKIHFIASNRIPFWTFVISV